MKMELKEGVLKFNNGTGLLLCPYCSCGEEEGFEHTGVYECVFCGGVYIGPDYKDPE